MVVFWKSDMGGATKVLGQFSEIFGRFRGDLEIEFGNYSGE